MPPHHSTHFIESLGGSSRLHTMLVLLARGRCDGEPPGHDRHHHLLRKLQAHITVPPRYAVSGLPVFRFTASGLVPDEGFAAWREIMARMFHIDRTRAAGSLAACHLSRAVRAQFGAAPRDWRRQQVVNSRAEWQAESGRLDAFWRELGR